MESRNILASGSYSIQKQNLSNSHVQYRHFKGIIIISSAPGLYIIAPVGHIKGWSISILDTLGQTINYRGGLISGVVVLHISSTLGVGSTYIHRCPHFRGLE